MLYCMSHLACHRNPSCHLHNQSGLFRLSVWISLKRWTIATWLVQTDTVAGWLCTRSPQIPEPWNAHAVQYSALTVPLKNWAQMAEPCSPHMISRHSYKTGEWNTACPQHTIPSLMVALSLLLKLQNESWWATLDPMVTWTMTSLPEPLWSIVILPYLMVALPLPGLGSNTFYQIQIQIQIHFFPEFQIQIQIHRQKSDQIQIQIQIQLIKYKYKYTMRPRQNCRHFTDDILKFIVL